MVTLQDGIFEMDSAFMRSVRIRAAILKHNVQLLCAIWSYHRLCSNFGALWDGRCALVRAGKSVLRGLDQIQIQTGATPALSCPTTGQVFPFIHFCHWRPCPLTTSVVLNVGDTQETCLYQAGPAER